VATERRRGFTLLELMLALVIFSTALLLLGATVSNGIGATGDSINLRAAREICRAQLEAVVAGSETGNGGSVDGHPGFTWSMTKEEKTVGAQESPTEKYEIITVTVSYPSDTPAPGGAAPGTPPPFGTGPGQASIQLTTFMDPPDVIQAAQQAMAQLK